MLNKVKDYLGIEGVKLALDINESFSLDSGVVHGTITLFSMRKQTVSNLRLEFREKYTRGRKEEKLIDTYILGFLSNDCDLLIEPEYEYDLPFELHYVLRKSKVDNFADKSIFLKPLKHLAKFSAAAKSQYSLSCSAQIQGVKLNPEVKINLE